MTPDRNAVQRWLAPRRSSGFLAAAVALAPRSALAESGAGFDDHRLAMLAGATLLLVVMGLAAWAILGSRRMAGYSLFNRLFIVLAIAAGLFSAISSAIGFSLITSQESADFFRNAILPPAFGLFVFVLSVSIWVGGGEMARHRDWFRKMRPGLISDFVFFIERAVKLFVVMPVLAAILFFVSTWTTVVGVGGVDAVRHTYSSEIGRLQQECGAISAWRQRDHTFLEDLRLSVSQVRSAADAEREGGAQTGAAGRGAVTAYIARVADWYAGLEASVAAIIEGPDPAGASPYEPGWCEAQADALKRLLAVNAYENYDRWAREFSTAFDDFAGVLNRWRRDERILRLLEQQLSSFTRANPKPSGDAGGRLTPAQRDAIDRYAETVEKALESLLRKQRARRPPIPLPSAAELSPERGLDILARWIAPPDTPAEPERRRARTQAVIDAEFVPGLSTITPRDAVLKHANIFSDVWALALAWDYAAYVLLFAYLFFPSAERAAGRKD